MIDTDRGQSEPFQHILMAAILIGVVSVGGVTVLAEVDNSIQNTPPTADFDATIDANNVTIIHEGGDAITRSDLSVVVQYRSGGTLRFRLSDTNTTLHGDQDTLFQTGEKAIYPHTFSPGIARISVFHTPTNRGLFETEENIPVDPRPTARFSISCSKIDCSFDASASTDEDDAITSYSWEFGDTATADATNPTISHTYSTGGTYTVTLTVTDGDGRSDTTNQTITIYDTTPPTADFSYSPSSPTSVDTVSFTDQSSDSDGSIASYQWSFGDGNTSTAQNPTHSYPDDGTYEVTLTVTDDVGASDTTSQTITVINAVPTADFNVSPASPQPSETVTFTDESVDSDGIISEWEWDLGDGTTSTQQNLTSSYSAAGTYTVSLTVTDNDNATATKSETVQVSTDQSPIADFSFSPSSPKTFETVTFTDNSSDSDGTIENREWDFGDGSTGSGTSPTHSYSDDGSYTVSLTVTDNDGKTDTVTQSISVSNRPPSPTFSYSPSVPTTEDTIQFDASASTDQDGTISSYEWDFGDGGSTLTGETVTKRYDSRGTYTVTLTLTDDDGATNTTTRTVTVEQEPLFSNTPTVTDTTQGKAAYDVNYDVSDPDNRLKNVTVVFENLDSPGETATKSSTATTDTISYSAQSGNTKNDDYRITVEVYNTEGTLTDSYRVSDVADGTDPGENALPTPKFSYSPANPVGGESVSFDASASFDSDGSISKYEWDWDNNGVYEATGVTATHSFPDDGSYVVTLRVSDDALATNTTTKTITVTNAPPVADGGGPYAVDEGNSTQLDAASSTDQDGSIASYSWSIQNDPTGEVTLSDTTTATPTFTAANDVSSNVDVTLELTVTDDDGATNTTTTTVTITDTDAPNTPPVVDAGGPYSVFERSSVTLDGTGSTDTDGVIASYSWTITNDPTGGASLTDADTATPMLNAPNNVNTDTDVTLELTVTDDDGATNTTTTTVTITDDTTPPGIDQFSITNQSKTTGNPKYVEFKVDWTVSDNRQLKNISITMAPEGGSTVDSSSSSLSGSSATGSTTLRENVNGNPEGDRYTITIVTYDLDGNRRVESKTISVS